VADAAGVEAEPDEAHEQRQAQLLAGVLVALQAVDPQHAAVRVDSPLVAVGAGAAVPDPIWRKW
jgi:hypothetical protein